MILHVFHAEAEGEFDAAARFYNSRSPGLGTVFLDAVEKSVALIREYPELGSPIGHRVRRVLVSGFPYAVIYRVDRQTLFVVAVAHLRRHPGYWINRGYA